MLMLLFPVMVEDTLKRAHLTRIREALRHADISLEKAARYMGPDDDTPMDKGQLCRELSGIGHLNFSRLMKLPPDFWRWYGTLLVEDIGVPKAIKRAARLRVAVRGLRTKMATVGNADSERGVA